MKVGVIDYGVGNLGSMLQALEELRAKPVLLDRVSAMNSVDCLILPGVGNFADCAMLLENGGWMTALQEAVLIAGRPLLGVCVGMQLLADSSTEGGGARGLGMIPGQVEHLRAIGCALRVPHVGWNGIAATASTDGLFDGIADGTDFYFTHSYAFVAEHPADLIATTDYGVPVAAGVRRGRVWGTQFHPEKSSRAGFRVLRNFMALAAC